MSPRLKKLIATLLIVLIWLPLYMFFITGLQWRVLSHAAWYVSLIFYALAGTAWILPIGLALPWMYREPKQP
jgi:hypothetical protein